MLDGALQPTTTHRVRGFLAGQGVDLKPWSGLDETYAAFYQLLRERQDDPAFWEPLGRLLEELARDPEGRGSLPAPRAELLTDFDRETVLRDLRGALPPEGAMGPSLDVAGWVRSLSGPVLGSFLLFGLAASGCDWTEDCPLEENSSLWNAIDESDMGYQKRADLCPCLSEMNADWDEGLTNLFETGSEGEIAAVLEEMVECCNHDTWVLNENYEDVEQDLIDRTRCDPPSFDPPPIGPQPAYKGVAFPD
jgi:hypothetical protein